MPTSVRGCSSTSVVVSGATWASQAWEKIVGTYSVGRLVAQALGRGKYLPGFVAVA